MVGRMASARKAAELGYAIEPDHGPSGRLGHWAIAGIPNEALEVHSKRSAEIDAEMAEHGYSSYRARNIAARETRKAKRRTPVADLLPRWRSELAEAGFPVHELAVGIEAASAARSPLRARGRAYTLARTVATESAVAEIVARRATEQDVAVLGVAQAVQGVWAAEADLGGILTDGQRDTILGVCTSGAGVDLVLGVAGAGKTTAIAGVRHAYEQAGYQVVGTSTSGQAARTLGTEAGIDVSRTLRSLLWRVDHGRLELDRGTVVVHDESGMATDTDVLRLLVAAELASAKVVMVGDDRQLGAVGPGGALRALLERHRPAAHILKDNIRQDDPNERRALAHTSEPATCSGLSPGTPTKAGSSPFPPARRPSTPSSTPGPPTSALARRPPCTPGGVATSRNSTAGPGPVWPLTGACRDRT